PLFLLPSAAHASASTLSLHDALPIFAAVLDLEEPELRIAHGGPSNEDAIGPRAAGQTLLATADEALQQARITSEQLAAAVMRARDRKSTRLTPVTFRSRMPSSA